MKDVIVGFAAMGIVLGIALAAMLAEPPKENLMRCVRKLADTATDLDHYDCVCDDNLARHFYLYEGGPSSPMQFSRRCSESHGGTAEAR